MAAPDRRAAAMSPLRRPLRGEVVRAPGSTGPTVGGSPAGTAGPDAAAAAPVAPPAGSESSARAAIPPLPPTAPAAARRGPSAYDAAGRPATGDHDVRRGLRVAAGYSWRLIVIGIAVYAVFLLLGRLQFVAIAVFVGLVLAALLRPLADLLDRVLPRGLAVALSLLLALVVIAGIFTFIGASVAGSWSGLSAQFSGGVAEIQRWLTQGPLHLRSADLTRLVEQGRSWIGQHRGALIGQLAGGAGVAAEIFAGMALAVFCAIFFIHSGDRMWAWFLDQLPDGPRGRWDSAGRAGWTTFAGYTRGIVVVAATNGALVGIALGILRVPLALPLALLVFFATFIPLVGAPVALAVATVVALAARGPWIAIAVLVLIVIIGQLEGHVLQPLVMSRAVHLHPVAVGLAVASGTVLAGTIGAVVAVPLIAVGWSVARQLRPSVIETPPPTPAAAAGTDPGGG